MTALPSTPDHSWRGVDRLFLTRSGSRNETKFLPYAIGIVEFVRADGRAYLSPGGKLSLSQSNTPQFFDVGHGVPDQIAAA